MADTIARNKTLMADAIARKNLTLKEAAAWYGVSVRTLRRRIAEGALPAYRVGPRAIRVRSEDVAALGARIPVAGGHDAAA